LPVVIAYRTAAIIDGKPHFFPDLYRKDTALTAALARQSNATTASAQGRNPS
jgi:murein L,D-transpeptidase YcbB/YkuD